MSRKGTLQDAPSVSQEIPLWSLGSPRKQPLLEFHEPDYLPVDSPMPLMVERLNPQALGFMGFYDLSIPVRGVETSATINKDKFRAGALSAFWTFVHERQRIWVRRFAERLQPPWTSDQTLGSVHFTNVYRELDPGTQYALRGILETSNPDPDKIFNIMIYRLIGREETHSRLGFQLLRKFDPIEFEHQLKQIRKEGNPPFTGAYMVSAFTSMGSADKIENVVRLLSLLQRRFGDLYADLTRSDSAEMAFRILSSPYGFGVFLAYQVMVDLLYPLKSRGGKPSLPFSNDDWAVAGPGARKGIRLLMRSRMKAPEIGIMRWLAANQETEFSRLGLGFPYLQDRRGNPIRLTLANIQNCLCEYYKYAKIRSGTGRGRRKFPQRINEYQSVLGC